jgi:cellobiose PTS system EIIC component
MNLDNVMEKFQGTFEKISENRYLKAISKAMVMTIPATMTGALCTLISNLPFEGYQNFLISTGLKDFLIIPGIFTTNIMAIVVVYFVAYNMARSFDIDGTVAGFLGIVSFLIMTPIANIDLAGDGNLVRFISFDWIGSRGMFVAILVGLIIGRLYALFMVNKIYIRMPKTVPSFVEKSFAALIPFFCLVLLSALASWGIGLTSQESIHQIIYTLLQVPLQSIGGSIGGVLIAYVAINLFWWFGIHGKALVFAVVAPIWAALSAENLAATTAGELPPHLIDLGFTTIFMEIGGGGCVLGLALLFTFLAKSERYRTVGKLTFIPTFFGINEPITFGTPIVLNTMFFIPTVLTPIITGLIGYGAILIGFLPRMTGASLPTGVPTLFNAIILAGWKGLLVQLLGIAVSVAFYYPFFRIADKQELKSEIETKANEQEKNETEEPMETVSV